MAVLSKWYSFLPCTSKPFIMLSGILTVVYKPFFFFLLYLNFMNKLPTTSSLNV